MTTERDAKIKDEMIHDIFDTTLPCNMKATVTVNSCQSVKRVKLGVHVIVA